MKKIYIILILLILVTGSLIASNALAQHTSFNDDTYSTYTVILGPDSNPCPDGWMFQVCSAGDDGIVAPSNPDKSPGGDDFVADQNGCTYEYYFDHNAQSGILGVFFTPDNFIFIDSAFPDPDQINSDETYYLRFFNAANISDATLYLNTIGLVAPSVNGVVYLPGSSTYNEFVWQSFTPSTTYEVSGIVTDGTRAPLQYVTIDGINTDPAQIVTGADGLFSFTCNEGDDVTITPSRTGYDFDPVNYVYNAIDDDHTNSNFVGTEWNPQQPENEQPTGTDVSVNVGQISWDAPGGTVPVTEYIVTFSLNDDYSDPIIDAQTTTELFYAIPDPLAYETTYYARVLANYTAPVPPRSKSDGIIKVGKQNNLRGNSDPLDWEFTTEEAPVPEYTISGIVSDGARLPLEGITINGTNTTPASVETGVDGSYTFTALEGADVTITPDEVGYNFDPLNYVYNAIDANHLDADFVATEWAPLPPTNGVPSGTDVAIDVGQISWDAPGGTVPVTEYIVTFSLNDDYSDPIIDAQTTTELFFAIPNPLVYSTTYYARVVANYTLPRRANSDPLDWDFTTVELDPNPVCATDPIPYDGETLVAIDTDLGWTYTHEEGYTLPNYFFIYVDDEPTLPSPDIQIEPYAGEGDYVLDYPTDFDYDKQYYWRVVPTTDSFRGDAVDCQIWTFTTLSFVNNPPVADAGGDQTVDEGTLVQLDGSGSYDIDEDDLLYTWTAPLEITLSNPNIVNPTFTAPDVTADQVYTITLTVDDQQSRITDSDEVDITVLFVNQAPVADAGDDQTVPEGTMVYLDGSESYDPDGQEITYLWTTPPEITLDDATSPTPSFTAPDVLVDTDYICTLEVNDNYARTTDTDNVVITVLFVNQPPEADAGDDQIVDEGTLVNLDGTGSSDPDGQDLTYLWTAPPEIALDDPTSSTPTFTAPDVTADTDYTITLEVYDNFVRASDTDNVVITVIFINQPPEADAGEDQTVDEGDIVYLDGSGSFDPDGQDLTYLWTAPAEITLSDDTAESPFFIAPEIDIDTDFVIALEVSDGVRALDTDDVTIFVLNLPNHPPVAIAGDDQTVFEGETVYVDGSDSYDLDGDDLTYLWTGPPEIVFDDPTAVATSFVAPDILLDTDFTVTLTVDDGYVAREESSDDLVVTVLFVNQPPVADAGDDQTVDEGTGVILDGSGSYDPDQQDLTYLWTAPDDITLSDPTVVNPTFVAPDVLVDTDYTIGLEVNDNYGREVASDEVMITVLFVNQAPIADAGDDQIVDEGEVVTLDGTESYDPDEQEITYLWTAPPEITLDDPTSPTPMFTAPDIVVDTDYPITLEVNDNYGRLTATDEVVITVLFINQPPVAVAGDDQTVNEGDIVNLDGTGSFDPDGQDLIYLWTASPEIVFDDPTSPTPTFTAPDVTIDTDFTINLEVSDGWERDMDSDELVVTILFVNQPPVADAGDDQTVDEGVLVTLDGTGSYDPDGQDITYLWTAPPEITLDDPTSSTPTFTAPDVTEDMNYSITLEVNDNYARASDTDEIVVTVLFVNQAPVADAGDDQYVDEQSFVQLDGSGSYDPDGAELSYVWTAPEGINLSNPYVVNPYFYAPNVLMDEEFVFTLTVNDGQSRALDSDDVSVFVAFVNQVPIADAGDDQTVMEGEVVQLDGSDSYDLDGQELTYLWTGPPEIIFDDPTSEMPTFIAPDVTEDTNYTITLTVDDGWYREAASDEVVITVMFDNQPPVADAGEDQTVDEGDLVTLDGTGSYDPDGNELTYYWEAPEDIELSDPNSPTPTFTAPEVDEDEMFQFTLIVEDEFGDRLFDTDIVIITVLQVLNPNPVCAVDPYPENGAVDVPIDSQIGWSYYHDEEYSEPDGFRIFMAYDEDLTNAYEGYVDYTGEGEYLVDHPSLFDYETDYYWQVVPTTDGSRGDAVDCPVWSFTTVETPTFTVSGYVGVNALVDLGEGNTTNNSGYYSIMVYLGDDLTITPTLAGYDFEPVSVTFTDIQEDIVQNFEAVIWCPEAAENGLPQGEDVSVDVEELSWDPPSEGVEPTFYYLTFSDHPEFVNPILDMIEVYDTSVSLADIDLDYDTTYWVEVITNYTPPGENYGCNGPAYVWSFETEMDVDNGNDLTPKVTELIGNYPNPFNPTTTICFTVKENDNARLTIYNVKGQILSTQEFGPGNHEFIWSPQNEGSGVYFYQLHSKKNTEIKKMLMLK